MVVEDIDHLVSRILSRALVRFLLERVKSGHGGKLAWESKMDVGSSHALLSYSDANALRIILTGSFDPR